MDDGLEDIGNYIFNPFSIGSTCCLICLVGFLRSSSGSDTVGTTARVLANLSLDRPNLSRLHDHSVVGQLCRLLSQGEMDIHCRKNVVRAMRLLCRSGEGLEEMKQSEGLPLLLDALKSDNVELAVGAIQALEVVSTLGDPEMLQQLCSKEIMQVVVRYCGNSKDKVKRSAVNVLLKSSKLLDGRIALSSAGGVEALVTYLDTVDKVSEIFHEVVCALCTCCRDVISRQHLRDCGGLDKLITMLADHTHRRLHGNMMAALVCYYFDETTLKLMVMKMRLLQTLTYHLQKMTSHQEASRQQPQSESGKEDQEVMSPPEPKAEMGMDTTEMSTEREAETSGSCQMSMEIAKAEASSSYQIQETEAAESLSESEKTSPSDAECSPPRKRLRLDLETTDSPSSEKSGSCSFLDSLLSSSRNFSPKSHPPPSSPLLGDGKSTFESQVILMVSRMSHMKDCLVFLSYTETLLSILNFFLSSRPPNMHVFKVLTRVFMSPHCFQNCVLGMVPSKIHETIRLLDLPPSLSSDKSDVELVGLCRNLLEHISKNAESPYGQGALAHLLLRGNEKERQASCLSMPLLCK